MVNMNLSLLISGGQQRINYPDLEDGQYYGSARLLLLDLISGKTKVLLDFSEGNNHYPKNYPNLQFTAGHTEETFIWLPTDTEIRIYKYPEMLLERIISHPFFNNIHSVTLHKDKIYVTSTGLDMVAILDKKSGAALKLINVEGKDPWHRFSKDVDYRLIHSTRPHQGHPNYIFFIEGKPWVTRCTQEDAVSLENLTKRIDISGPDKIISVHDGHVYDGKIFFTSVDGMVLIADIQSRKIIKKIDLYALEKKTNYRPKGWCRGLFVKGSYVYVGFSKFRKTKVKSRLSWIKSKFTKRPYDFASVAVYDWVKNIKINEFKIPEESINAIYSLLPEPDIC